MKSNHDGITLLEIMLAVAILLLAVIPLMGIFDFANLSTKKSKTQSVATGLAVSIKQECEHQPFEEFGKLALANPGAISIPASLFPKTMEEIVRFNDADKYPDFSPSAVCYPYLDGNKHLAKLEIKIDWKDKRGAPKNVKLATFIISQKVY
tara:strand:- start:2 stop:454 length:453 start_codon:yes stop_codon:yes gene_type:complete